MIAGGHGLPVVHGDRREGVPFGRGFRQPAVFPRGNHRQGEMKDIWEPYLNDDCKIFAYLDHLTPTSALGPHSVLAYRTRYRIHATATLTLDLHFGDPLTASGLDRDQCGSHISMPHDLSEAMSRGFSLFRMSRRTCRSACSSSSRRCRSGRCKSSWLPVRRRAAASVPGTRLCSMATPSSCVTPIATW